MFGEIWFINIIYHKKIFLGFLISGLQIHLLINRKQKNIEEDEKDIEISLLSSVGEKARK
ncbi:hypothetical protein BC008_04710 [Mastigocoleus testarum BC008]|uniref:Uncharacterized protein n=1 Tax=Mastigocoleus testarum BC008 TaxID=371196 RepID=A0A0V7ZBY3_9CYAN|nr:hypothetical protein BC008_07230 [Mastigocoleus testarum BC008]KST69607.1 hypothetical protein BC008_04710 [Mastigocoleus testarum BC008]